MKTGKNVARALPTLTQVVEPRVLPALGVTDHTALANSVVQSLMPKVEEKLRRAVEQAVQQQMPDLYAALRIEIDVAIREEITKSLQSTVAFPTAKSGA